MYRLPLLLLLSFNVAAQTPLTNFNSPSNYSEICNDTKYEPASQDDNTIVFGESKFKVLFTAYGCAGMNQKQGYVCNVQIVQPDHCVHYHFRGGTSEKAAQICVLNTKDNDWECGSSFPDGHFSFPVNNNTSSLVHNLSLIRNGKSRIVHASVVTSPTK